MTDYPPVDAADSDAPRTRDLVAILLAAVLALFGLTGAFPRASCLLLLPIAALAAAPIWLFLVQRELLTRQALIRSVATETGYIRRWFFTGTITKVVLVFVALGLATALVSLLTALRAEAWFILAADAFLLALIINPVRDSLGDQIRKEHLGPISRLLPILAGNVVVLVLAFVVLNAVSAHTMVQSTWYEVAVETFHGAREGVTCSGAGLLVGAAAAVDQLAWKAAIALIPQLPGTPARVVGWVVFLALTGFGAVLFTQFMLGVVAIVEQRTTRQKLAGQRGTVWGIFLATVLVLAVPYSFTIWKLTPWEPQLAKDAEDPCAGFQFDASSLKSSLRADVDEARRRAYELADQRVEAALDTTFAKAEEGVDAYLEWYFSLYGDYSRLLGVMVGDLGRVMQDNLSKHVFDDTGFDQMLEAESLGIQQATLELMSNASGQLAGRVRQAVNTSSCPIPNINLDGLINLNKDRVRFALDTTSAFAAGRDTVKTLGKRAAAAAASKAAASRTVKMAAKIAGRAVANRVGSAVSATVAGTAVCSAAGPVAIVCGITAGVISWVAVDKAVLEIEEYVSRDKMRDELLEALNEQRQTVEQGLKKVNRARVDAYAMEINDRADKIFVPIRDGL